MLLNNEKLSLMEMFSVVQVPHWFARDGDTAGYHPSFHRTNWFEPVGRECRAVRERVGVIDLSSFGVISVAGKDARKHLDKLFANSLPQVRVECQIFVARDKIFFSPSWVEKVKKMKGASFQCFLCFFFVCLFGSRSGLVVTNTDLLLPDQLMMTYVERRSVSKFTTGFLRPNV